MDKPCEHCGQADIRKEGYFKCETPCRQAKLCYANNRITIDEFLKNLPDLQELEEGSKGHVKGK